MIDLHTHTTHSDGTLTPEELIIKAKEIGLNAVAITDHDTISGLNEGIKAAKKHEITFIPGVELEIEYPYSGEFHLLGLGLKNLNGNLKDSLIEIREYREKRNHEIIRLMQNDGLDIDYKCVDNIAGGDIVARPHFAKALINKGYVKNQKKAFTDFLNPGSPYYVPKKTLTLDKAIDLIHDAGGKAIVAHPQSLYISWSKFPSILKGYKELGLDGIEAWHGGNNRNDCTKFEKIASDLQLIVTGGSDYHGDNIKDRVLGIGAGRRNIPEILLSGIQKEI